MDDAEDRASDGSLGLGVYMGLDTPGELPGFGGDDDNFDDNTTEAQGDVLESWNALPIDEKWEHIMSLLRSEETPWRWDEKCGDPRTSNFIESYKKEGLTVKDDRDTRSPTILHMLAKNFDKDGFAGLDEQTRQRIINYLLDHRKRESQARGKKDTKEDPVLTVAMQWDNKEFIQCLIRHCVDSMGDLLDASDVEGTNCLHHVFKFHFPSALDDYILRKKMGRKKTGPVMKLDLRTTYPMVESFAKFARAETIAAQDKEGNTPLHYALHYRLCRMPVDSHPSIVSQLVETVDGFFRKSAKANQFNFKKKPESPYLYHLRTQREFHETLQGRKQPSSSPAPQTSQARPTGTSGQKDTANDAKTKPQISRDAMLSRGGGRTDEPASAGGYEGPGGGPGRSGGSGGRSMDGKGKTGTVSSSARGDGQPAAKETAGADVNPVPKSTSLMPGAPSGHGLVRRTTAAVRSRSPSPMSKLARARARVRNAEVAVPPTAAPSSSSAPAPRTHPAAQPDGQSSESKPQAKTPYPNGARPAQGSAKSPSPPEDDEVFRIAAEKIRNKLKLHYIRTRPDIDAKELLYGKVASDKNLYFDATHLEGKSSGEMAELINLLSRPGGFDDTLSYVHLPCLGQDHSQSSMAGSKSNQRAYGANQRRQRDSMVQPETGTGRDSLVTVFDMLAKSGVCNILHLHVDDIYDKTPSHSDAAIERSIRGADGFFPDVKRNEGEINIENWDWMKLDLSIDVIRFAAPNVVKINLYWSGNQTVLRSWACNEGIPRLYLESKKKMKRVVLHASPGMESIERMKKTLKQFQDEIRDRTEGEVKVSIERWMSDKAAGMESDGQLKRFGAGQGKHPPDHDWVKSMETFRRALALIHRTMPKEVKPQRIKVALIDDGVHLSSLDTYDKCVQVTGLSYWTPTIPTDGTIFGQPWHQSTHGHGTIMANMLVRLNPWVSLYVIRIQDEIDNSPTGGGAIKIHAKSAAMAIKAAVIRDVDIISMSWTIRDATGGGSGKAPRSYEEQSMQALRDAIDEARSRNILMFCSASDDIKDRSTDSLPYSQAQGYIFRIGAAGPSGQRETTTEDPAEISWFFPGNQVAEAINPRSVKILEYHSGSSVSTALAAGLASLIMYLPRVLQAHHELVAGEQSDAAARFATFSGKLRERDNMKKAFDNVKDESHEDKKFLPVWHMFGRRADRILESSSPGGKAENQWSILEKLVTELCFKLDL